MKRVETPRAGGRERERERESQDIPIASPVTGSVWKLQEQAGVGGREAVAL